MTREPDTRASFERLSAEIADAEGTLRDAFADTPTPEAAGLRRIKDRLHIEALAMQRAQSSARPWQRCLAATAGTILLVVGIRFYAMSGYEPKSASPGQMIYASASLEAFTASLPSAPADEDPELQQLQTDLWRLEMQATSNATDSVDTDEPAAQRGAADSTRSLAAADHRGERTS